MSTHVIPDGERWRHVTTMDCECGPYEQLGFDIARPSTSALITAIVHRELDRIVAGEVIRESEST